MRINSAAMMNQSHQVQKNSVGLSKIYEKLASGKRINRASDDAAGRAVAEELLKMTRGYSQGTSNIGDAMSALKIADGAAGGISDMLQRQRELAIQASSDTLNDTQRGYLNDEYQALGAEIDRLAQSSQFNGMSTLDGSSPLSDGTGVIHSGPQSGDSIQLDRLNFTVGAIGANGDISTRGGAASALSSTDRAMDSVNAGRSTIGARINRFEHNVQNNLNQEVNTAYSQSLIEELDFAEGVMERSRQELLGQSSISAQSNFQSISRNNLLSLLS